MDERRMREFVNLEPLPEPDIRRRRLEEQDRVRSKFVSFGDALWDLRVQIDNLSASLISAITHGQRSKEEEARALLREVEKRDPELVYLLELAQIETAMKEGHEEDARKHKAMAAEARLCLPQFNLDGLWVGKYGSHGYELINVTYVGDTLIATKVTGDRNVPRGEITFQADLSPLRYWKNVQETKTKLANSQSVSHVHPLQPIALTEKAARKWGTRQLPRYVGLGQVAEEGFLNNQWMDGQLIIIGEDYFSFAWTPIEQQIFFGRPSPELALKMLRENGVTPLRTAKSWAVPPSLDDDVKTQMEFLSRCFERTSEYEEELHEEMITVGGADGYGCIFKEDTEEFFE